jgi:hypothetical protein
VSQLALGLRMSLEKFSSISVCVCLSVLQRGPSVALGCQPEQRKQRHSHIHAQCHSFNAIHLVKSRKP